MSLALALHVLAVVVWVGGMFFAYMTLRPVAAEDWPAGGKALAQIHGLVGINTAIGIVTIIIAAGGKYFL